MTNAFNLSQLANKVNSSGQLAAGTGLSGQVPIANGGTGTNTAPTNGKLLIGNASGGWTVANLTAGTNITISNTSGAITINASATAPVYSPEFTNPGVNNQLTWNHGLGSRPRRFGMVAVLTTDVYGTPAGTAFAVDSNDGDGGRQKSVYANTTVCGFFGSSIYVRGFDTNNIEMTPANSNLYFWAEK